MRAAAAALASWPRVALRSRPLARLSLPPRLRRRLLALLACLAVLGAVYLLWARDSSLVRVKDVAVAGATTSDAPRLRAALAGEARNMTTLHVRHDRFERIVEAFPSVRAVRTEPDFPSKLRIEVIEWQPVAIAVSGRTRVAVGADGDLLRGVPQDRALPVLELRAPPRGDRLDNPSAVLAARVAGAAPAGLEGRLRQVRVQGGRGLVVELRRGPDLVFGEAAQLTAKWTAAARVLADSASRGADYVDLRTPDRPVAGGLPVEGPATPPNPQP